MTEDEEAVHRLTARVLRAVAEADAHDTVWWRVDGKYAPITWFVNCPDLFAWGTADLEPITAETIEAFEMAYADVRVVTGGDPTYGSDLYACRQRHQRPQGAAYPTDRRLWPLFDACGPERELGVTNPKPPGDPLPADVVGHHRKGALAVLATRWTSDDATARACNCDDPSTHDGAAPALLTDLTSDEQPGDGPAYVIGEATQ